MIVVFREATQDFTEPFGKYLILAQISPLFHPNTVQSH